MSRLTRIIGDGRHEAGRGDAPALGEWESLYGPPVVPIRRGMKAIVQTGAREVEVQDRGVPTPGPREALVKVHTAGLCGSDAHAYKHDGGYEWIPIPRIMGHEYSAEVVEVGDEVETVAPGDRVIERPIHHCGECFQCHNGQPNVCQNFSIKGMHTDGAYAEFVATDVGFLHRIPDEVPLRHAAVTEPLSIATRAVLDRSVTEPGSTVLVEGPGPIGVFTAVVAHELGARVLVSGLDQDADHRLPLVEQIGIDSINVDETDLEDVREEVTDGIGFDVIFDTTGHRTGIEVASEHVRKGGQIVVIGLPADSSDLFMTPLVRGEVDLNTSYGSLWRNFEQALRMMQQDRLPIEDILDDSFSVDRPADAFEAFLASENCKPVFQFD